jgi:large subunit ribosomal protein L25
MELSIECKQRVAGSKPNQLRRDGITPANLYGHKGSESESLTVSTKDLEMLLRKAQPGKTAVEVSIPELSWKGTVVVQDVHKHPWKSFAYHVSFYANSNK